MEASTKGECIELAIDSLMQLQECYVEAVDWLDKSKAFIPDDSEAIQDLKAALAESIKREAVLEQKLAASLARERRLTSYIGGLSKVAAEAESILEDVRNIGNGLPTPTFEDLMHIMAHGRDSIPPEDWYTEPVAPSEPKPSGPPNRRVPLM